MKQNKFILQVVVVAVAATWIIIILIVYTKILKTQRLEHKKFRHFLKITEGESINK